MMSEKTKVYTYTRVSTTMQIDGYSLDAQKSRVKSFADFNDFEIVKEYEDAGKLMISVLSAVAEIERENIRVQTMEGRAQKAREEKWNGGFAPYGYMLSDGYLVINEEEAEAIRTIFDRYVNTEMGANGVAKYLGNHGIKKIPRANGKNTMFDAGLIRKIIKNPVYCGKIAYGRRRMEKVHGTRNDYHQVNKDDYILAEGVHEGIISEELWDKAQVKVERQSKKYEHVNKPKGTYTHLLSCIVKCPVCGVGMYGTKSIKRRPDGTRYKDFLYYGCKHRTMIRGHKCSFSKQIREELLDEAVKEVIVKLVSNPKFADMMQKKINMKVDTDEIDKELESIEKELRRHILKKDRIIEELDSLNVEDKHYSRMKNDYNDRLYKIYDKIEELENLLSETRKKKRSIENDKVTADNVYKTLIYFEELYDQMNQEEKRQLLKSLIEEIHIYDERKENGQLLKSIKFRLPIIEGNWNIGLNNDGQGETVCLLSKGVVDKDNFRKVKVDFSLEDMDLTELRGKATYAQVKEYILNEYGLKVSSLYIAQVKKKCGIETGENHNLPKSRMPDSHR